MNILLLNGSPRRAAASSRLILDQFRAALEPAHSCSLVETQPAAQATPADLAAGLVVVAFPLYVDSLPSGLLEWLLSYELLRKAEGPNSHSPMAPGQPAGTTAPAPGLIAIANCGFHEGEQNRSTLEILQNFCSRSGLQWLGGLGIGTGEMIRGLKDAPPDMFIKRPVSAALDSLTDLACRFAAGSDGAAGPALDQPAAGTVNYVRHAFPRFLYRLAGHAGWKKEAAAHGITPAQLLARPLAP